MQVPILKFKKNNPVLQIKMVTPEDLTDIKKVRLFYLGKDSLWTRNSNPVQFGADEIPSGSITFKGNQRLDTGKNFFWLAYKLADNANLYHKIDAGCN